MVRKKINLRFVIRSYFFWVVLPMATLFLFAYALDFLVHVARMTGNGRRQDCSRNEYRIWLQDSCGVLVALTFTNGWGSFKCY